MSSASPVQETKAVGMTSDGAVGVFEDVGGGGGVPGGVAAGFKGGADAAGGEGGGVRLALDEFLAGEFEDRLAIAGGREERVMLFGGDAGHGVEDVGVVGGALFDGPVLHGDGDGIGDGGVQRRALA